MSVKVSVIFALRHFEERHQLGPRLVAPLLRGLLAAGNSAAGKFK